MAKIVEFDLARKKASNKQQRAPNLVRHPETWMLLSPTVFERISGIRVSREELADMRKIICEIRAKATT